MSYTPAWNALFAKPLLNQLIAIIQRDQVAVLAVVNAQRAALGNNKALTPINGFYKGGGEKLVKPPWLTVAFDGGAFDPEQDLLRAQGLQISLALDTGQFDNEFSQDDGLDYLRLLDIIVSTSAMNRQTDWSSSLPIVHKSVPKGQTVPNPFGTVKRVFIAQHQAGIVKVDEVEGPVYRVTLQIVFDLMEGPSWGM